MKKILITAALICSPAYLNADRRQNLVNVRIKNSTGQPLTVATHQGNITIPFLYKPTTIQVQLGQPYEIKASATKGTPTYGSISNVKFTQTSKDSYFEVLSESDLDASDPNALKLTVTKINTSKTNVK
jgi:hypothetical protein